MFFINDLLNIPSRFAINRLTSKKYYLCNFEKFMEVKNKNNKTIYDKKIINAQKSMPFSNIKREVFSWKVGMKKYDLSCFSSQKFDGKITKQQFLGYLKDLKNIDILIRQKSRRQNNKRKWYSSSIIIYLISLLFLQVGLFFLVFFLIKNQKLIALCGFFLCLIISICFLRLNFFTEKGKLSTNLKNRENKFKAFFQKINENELNAKHIDVKVGTFGAWLLVEYKKDRKELRPGKAGKQL